MPSDRYITFRRCLRMISLKSPLFPLLVCPWSVLEEYSSSLCTAWIPESSFQVLLKACEYLYPQKSHTYGRFRGICDYCGTIWSGSEGVEISIRIAMFTSLSHSDLSTLGSARLSESRVVRTWSPVLAGITFAKSDLYHAYIFSVYTAREDVTYFGAELLVEIGLGSKIRNLISSA